MSEPDFRNYLESVRTTYTQWWKEAAFIEEINDETWFEFILEGITKSKQSGEGEKSAGKSLQEIPKPLLSLIGDYRLQKILIVGEPGAGKSTVLTKLLLDAAEKALVDENAPIPVLVKLKNHQLSGDRPGIRGLILENLESHDPMLDESALKYLLSQKKLLLLADGLNELSYKPAEDALKNLCRHQAVIATSRNVNDWSDIDRKIEIKPLTAPQVQQFLEKRLPYQDRAAIEKLSDRVRDFGRTPLMVWMLYTIFQATKETPDTRGEAYRQFTEVYVKRAKAGIDLAESRFLLSRLAFEMMKSSDPADPAQFSLEISEFEAQNLLGSATDLSRLIDSHLIQASGEHGKRHIRFCHQTLQEYYAAEALLEKLHHHPEWLEKAPGQQWTTFQQDYLNYLKWTEAIALMFGLLASSQTRCIIKLALEVDLILAAKLLGSTNPSNQIPTIESIVPEEPEWLKLRVLDEIGSSTAVKYLIPLLDHPNHDLRYNAYFTLLEINPEVIPNTCRIKEDGRRIQQLLKDISNESEPEQPAPLDEDIIENLDADIRCIFGDWVTNNIDEDEVIYRLSPFVFNLQDKIQWSVVQVLGCLNTDKVIPILIQLIENINSSSQYCAGIALGKLGFRSAIPLLNKIIQQNPDSHAKIAAIQALYILSSDEGIPGILSALCDSDTAVCYAAIKAADRINNEEIISQLIRLTSYSILEIKRSSAHILRELNLEKNREILFEKRYELFQCLEYPDIWVRWKIVALLWNIISKIDIPLLRLKFDQSDSDIKLAYALLLGRFGCEAVIPELIYLTDFDNLSVHPNVSEIVQKAAYSLGEIEGSSVGKYLPELLKKQKEAQREYVFSAIAVIQKRCGFYNYEIAQAAGSKSKIRSQEPDSVLDKLNAIHKEVKAVSEFPRYDFSGSTLNNSSLNFASNYGDQSTTNIDTQNNYSVSPEVEEALRELKNALAELQAQYPATTNEIQAYEIIEAEIVNPTTPNASKLVTLRKQLLNPERHLKASKATLVEIAKHFVEQNIFAKAFFTYLDKMSEEPGVGA